MLSYRKIHIIIDADSGKQIKADGSKINTSTDYIRLLFDEMAILCVEFVSVSLSDGVRTLTPCPISPDMVFTAVADCDYLISTTPMLLTEPADVNVAGDWLDGSTASLAMGQLSFRISTNTKRFNDVVDGTIKRKYEMSFEALPVGQLEKVCLAKIAFNAENRPSSTNIEPPEIPPSSNYPDKAEVEAIVRQKLVFAYSIDGTSWHADLRESDVYQRVKHGENGSWSDTQIIPRGHKGEAGNFENGLADVTFTPGGTLTKTAVELGIVGEPPVAVYDAAGYDVTADGQVSVKWSSGTLTVITPADATGTWRIKFAGGSVNIRERVAAWPRAVFAGRRCYLIDATSSELEIDDMLRNVATVSFLIRSASAVTGNIVLRADVDGAAVKTFVLPVTAADVMQKLTFDSAITGELKFIALTSDARWTLRDTDVVTAVVSYDIYTEVAR